jgi:hypothetical protein
MNASLWFSVLLHLMNAVSWPIAALVLVLLFRGSIIELIGSVDTIEAKGVKLLMSRLPPSARAELKGLSSEDIWALESFANENNQVPKDVDRMNGAQRLAARTLLDFKVLTLEGDGPNKRVTLTHLGREILDAAKSLPL